MGARMGKEGPMYLIVSGLEAVCNGVQADLLLILSLVI
jgi:hypothetical protein